MKQTKLRAVSTKRAAHNEAYRDLIDKLFHEAMPCSEWDGTVEISYGHYVLEPHHIDGRRGKRLLDPFNIILLTPEQHRTFQAHNSWEVRQALKLWVYGLRIQQGFVPND